MPNVALLRLIIRSTSCGTTIIILLRSRWIISSYSKKLSNCNSEMTFDINIWDRNKMRSCLCCLKDFHVIHWLNSMKVFMLYVNYPHKKIHVAVLSQLKLRLKPLKTSGISVKIHTVSITVFRVFYTCASTVWPFCHSGKKPCVIGTVYWWCNWFQGLWVDSN